MQPHMHRKESLEKNTLKQKKKKKKEEDGEADGQGLWRAELCAHMSSGRRREKSWGPYKERQQLFG